MGIEASSESQTKAPSQSASESPLMREFYVFGGALAASARKASSDPASLIKLGEGALMGAAMTVLQTKARPLAICLETLGLSGAVSASQSTLKSMTEVSDIWKRTWNSSKSVESDKVAAQKLTDSVVDFGLYAAGGMTSPALRALQLRPRWKAAEDIPFYRKPPVPPEQKMIDVFGQKQDAHGLIMRFEKNGTGPDAKYDIGNGTGVILKDYDGLVLTAHHVIEDADGFAAVFPGHKRSSVELLGADKKLDAALLRMTDSPAEPLTGVSLSEVGPIKGQNVVLIGYPVKHEFGIRASFGRFVGRSNSQENVFKVQSAKGFSGGSFLNESGELTAMITEGRSNGFLPGAEGRLINKGGSSSLGASSVELKRFIEANRHNTGVKLPGVDELLK